MSRVLKTSALPMGWMIITKEEPTPEGFTIGLNPRCPTMDVPTWNIHTADGITTATANQIIPDGYVYTGRMMTVQIEIDTHGFQFEHYDGWQVFFTEENE